LSLGKFGGCWATAEIAPEIKPQTSPVKGAVIV